MLLSTHHKEDDIFNINISSWIYEMEIITVIFAKVHTYNSKVQFIKGKTHSFWNKRIFYKNALHHIANIEYVFSTSLHVVREQTANYANGASLMWNMDQHFQGIVFSSMFSSVTSSDQMLQFVCDFNINMLFNIFVYVLMNSCIYYFWILFNNSLQYFKDFEWK